jgi:hypothetical protein
LRAVRDIDFRLHTLSTYILGKDNGTLDQNLKEIIKRMKEFQSQFCEGVPKVRLMKLLFSEVSELKLEEEEDFYDE